MLNIRTYQNTQYLAPNTQYSAPGTFGVQIRTLKIPARRINEKATYHSGMDKKPFQEFLRRIFNQLGKIDQTTRYLRLLT